MFVLLCAIVALLSLYLFFLCFSLLVQTRFRPYGLCYCSYTLAHIKGFGLPVLHVYACLLLCFMLVLASLVLGFAILDALSRLVVVWLHPMPMRPCLDVTIWDASPWCRLLCVYLPLFHSVQWLCLPCLFMPLLALYASLHACLHVHACVLLLSVSFILQHNEIMDTRSKPTFVPRGHHLLFAFLLVCLLSLLLFARILIFFLAMLVMYIYLMPLCYALCIFSPHCLFASFLVFAFACTHMERGRTELGHCLPSASKKGMNISMWLGQVAVFSKSRV